MRRQEAEQLGLVELNQELLAEAMRTHPHCVAGDVADLIGSLLHCGALFPPSLARQLLDLVDAVERELIRRGIDASDGCDSLRLLVMAHDAQHGRWWLRLPAQVRREVRKSTHTLQLLCGAVARQQQKSRARERKNRS